ncbi:polyubiquitin binding protein, putative [Plasmodium relictum]|uniref:Polyubiquitin binding protein, putative n=1 Tax=Plasmodium relictum TaxID=85471 RepID=A0A1J1H841_PLARL|nr:polyubiquitin binding protein, putative [Plasmodium relictum]CRH00725.1 polyubiquitin binding protein, putative [Plasmodium relictum]
MEDNEYELGGILIGHDKGIRSLCVISSNLFDELKDYDLKFQYIVSADCNGTIIVWKEGEYEEMNKKEKNIKNNINNLREIECSNDEKKQNENNNDYLYNYNFILYKKIEIHEKFIYSLCYSKYMGISELKNCKKNIENHLYIYSGGNDRNIYLFNLNGFIELVLQGHKNSICSIVEKNENILLSGDWNGEVFIWRIEKNEKEKNNNDLSNEINEKSRISGDKYSYSILKILNNHKHAVYVNYLNDLILTISQNNILNIWNSKGEKTDEIKNIHNDSVRDIILFNENKNVITFSNDENIHIYDINFNLIKIYKGHKGFIFYVCVNEKEKIMISCGDDKSIKIWCIKDIYELMKTYNVANLRKNNLINENFNCLQTIYLTDTLWNIKLLSNGDFACACNDSSVRIYTNKKEKKLKKEIIEIFEKQYGKKNNINDENVNGIENINNIIGKEGEIKIFKNKEKYEAYKYENSQWVLIGDVVDDTKSEKKFYIGDTLFKHGYYDEIFSIDTGYGSIKQLPYNKDDNILLIAEKFCKREGISVSHVKSIVDFINQNSPVKNNRENYEIENENKKKNFKTILNVFTVQKSSLDRILQKIKEFNLLLSDDDKYKLNNEDINSLTNIINIYIKDIKNMYKFNTADINLIIKLFEWSPFYIFPVIDLFRVLVLNKNCDFLFNNKYSFNAFKLVYDCISFYIKNSENLKENDDNKLDSLLLCCLRFYLNMFNLSTPRYYMYKKYNFILKQFSEIKSNNANINILFIKIFFNYIIVLNENNDNELRKMLFEIIHSFRNRTDDMEFIYIYSLCFHTSYNSYIKQTEEIIKKCDTINFIKNKLNSLISQKNEQNERFFKNVKLILDDLNLKK